MIGKKSNYVNVTLESTSDGKYMSTFTCVLKKPQILSDAVIWNGKAYIMLIYNYAVS